MLIDRGITTGTVISLKLSSGDEIIARLIEDNANGYKVSKPLMLSAGPQGIAMVPFMFTVDHGLDLTISKSSVIAIQATEKRFADQYMQGTTGIALS